jgi:hypothetical protein
VYDANRDPVADLDLFVLNPDGTETRVTNDRDWITGSISPDGSQVVYTALLDGRLYTVDTEGGEPHLLLAGAGMLYNPTFSPDGTQIAYFDGGGDWGHSLRVVNADGSGVRILFDQAPEEVGHVWNLVWSPDGSRLAFSAEEGGIWIVGVDGSELTEVIPDGVNVYWSPDGSRISYQSADALSGALGALKIAAADGTHTQEFGYGGSGPWNPLPLPVSPVTQSSPSFTETFDSPLHGLSIGYPSGWQTRAASEPWSHGEVTFDAPEVDVIFDPTLRDDLYLAMVSEPLDPGESETEWVSGVWPNVQSVGICRGGGGGGGDDTLQGNYGWFWSCDELHGASGSAWIVATATRGYIIYLYVGDEVPATYPVPDFEGAAVFGEAAARGETPEVSGVGGPTGFLETLDLRPGDAVDALNPSESP